MDLILKERFLAEKLRKLQTKCNDLYSKIRYWEENMPSRLYNTEYYIELKNEYGDVCQKIYQISMEINKIQLKFCEQQKKK